MESLNTLVESFRDHYPQAARPSVCRAPGRVNLIGEHTDYNGLSVLPMAIDREIRVVFAPRADSLVRMASPHDVFTATEFTNAARIEPSPQGSWDNYCKAALTGLNQHFHERRFPGMDMLVAGDIPIAAGLSSSSSLVVACALAYLHSLGKSLEADIGRLALAGLLAEAEHYVGTRGGGMDQAEFACERPANSKGANTLGRRQIATTSPAENSITAPKRAAKICRERTGISSQRQVIPLARKQRLPREQPQ